MANSSVVYVRMDSELKASAEDILAQLGITPSGAIQMLYKQIVLQNGLPFDLKLPRPLAIGAMTQEALATELQKGIKSVHENNLYTADAVDEEFSRELGI